MAIGSDLLLLADGRLPAGGHAHSGGLEQSVEQGEVHGIPSLEGFLLGLLRTGAETSISVAAAACAARLGGADAALLELDVEESARTPSASVRVASRAQARQLLRAAEAIWPGAGPISLPPFPHGPHLSVAHGIAAARLGLAPIDAARLAAYAAISGPATAAVRLLGLDPFAVHGTVARVMEHAEPLISRATDAAADAAGCVAAALPRGAAPLIEVGAELHRAREIRMFAS